MKNDFMPILIIMVVLTLVGVIWLNYNKPPDIPVIVQDTSPNIMTVLMPFDECRKSISKETFEKAGTQNKIIDLTDSKTSKIIKICTNKGSVMVTCNVNDNTRVTMETEDKQGC